MSGQGMKGSHGVNSLTCYTIHSDWEFSQIKRLQINHTPFSCMGKSQRVHLIIFLLAYLQSRAMQKKKKGYERV